MRKKLINAFLTSVVSLTAAGSVLGQAGSLDQTFAVGGVATTYVATSQGNLAPGGPNTSVAQSDGKILHLTDAHLNTDNSFTNVVVRYNADGSIDSTYGDGGFLYLNWKGPNGEFQNIYAIALQLVGSEQKLLLAGTGGSNSNLRVERYNIDGTIDSSFGFGGTARFTGGYALAIAVQSDGKIVTGGDTGAIFRLTPNGALDNTFGTGGLITTSAIKITSIAIGSDERIIAGGHSTSGKGNKGVNVMTIVRFNINGSLDNGGRGDSTPGDSFGSSGKTTVDFGAGSSCNELKIDLAERILCAGGTNANFAVARLLASGQLDNSFGSGGKATIDFAGFSDAAWSVEVQSDGRLILSGETNSTGTNNGNDFGVVRLNADGSIDNTFGQNGRSVSSFSSAVEYGRTAILQVDPICGCEKIVVLGTAEINAIDHAIAARYIL